MIGLDTNVLVRYLAQDDPIRSPLATELIERRLTELEPGFISVAAITETAWVLERAYRLSSGEIAAAIERILRAAELVVENEREVFAAMAALKQGRGSFADALIGELGHEAGCRRPSHSTGGRSACRGLARCEGFGREGADVRHGGTRRDRLRCGGGSPARSPAPDR